MGIDRLLTFLKNKRNEATKEVDLKVKAEETSAGGQQPILLCDFLGVTKALEINVITDSIKTGTQSQYCRFYGSHLRTLTKEIMQFVSALHYLGIKPVFVSDGIRTHSEETPQAQMDAANGIQAKMKKITDLERYRSKLALNSEWQMVCDGFRSSDDVKTILHPLSTIVCMEALLEADVQVIRCKGEADDTLISLCKANPAVLGILSSDTDFAVAQGCAYFPIPLFDTGNELGFNIGKINSEPKNLKCRFTNPEILAASLEIREDQVTELAILCGNDYTKPLNIHYRVKYHLGIAEARKEQCVIEVAKWLQNAKETLTQCMKSKGILYEDYKAAMEHSEQMYSGQSGQLSDIPTQSTIAKFSSFECENAGFTKGRYYRVFFVEDMSVGHCPAFDFTQPIRNVLYYMLEATVVEEEGRNYKNSRRRLKVPIPDLNINVQWLKSTTVDQLAKILSMFHLVANPLKSHENLRLLSSDASQKKLKRLSQSDPFLSMNKTERLHGSLVLAILKFLAVNSKLVDDEVFDIISENELQSLLATFVIVAAGAPPISYSKTRPKMKEISLSAVIWAAAVSAYPLAHYIGLSTFLPKMEDFFDTSIFVPLYMAQRQAVAQRQASSGKKVKESLQILWNFLEEVIAFPEVQEIVQWITSGLTSDLEKLIQAICHFQQAVHNTKHNVLPRHEPLLEKLRIPVKGAETLLDLEESKESDDDLVLEEYGGIAEVSPLKSSSVKKRQRKEHSQEVADQLQFSADQIKDELPIMEQRGEILTQICNHKVSIIDGKTGSGKSTQVPQFLYEHEREQGRLETCSIVITQPRRMAAKSLAERVASEMQDKQHKIVGYRIGGEQSEEHFTTKITYVTAGYLLKFLTSGEISERLSKFSHIILDEVHDRAAEADFLCLVVRSFLLWKHKCRTKVVLMSATLENTLYSEYFAKKGLDVAKPVFIEGRQYPVKQIYIDDLAKNCEAIVVRKRTNFDSHDLEAIRNKARKTVKEQCTTIIEKDYLTLNLKPGDPRIAICCNLIIAEANLGEGVLVFLPGLSEMMMLYDSLHLQLEGQDLQQYFRVFIMHSEVPMSDQREAYRPPPLDSAHIIIATSIAESSLTIPKLRLVINFCLRKQVKYNPYRNLSVLELQWCSQASCRQRGGRVGRVFPGTAVHLVTSQHYERKLPPYDDPEMVKSSLVRLLLQAKVLCSFLSYKRPSSLLKETLSPPSCLQLQDAVSNLYKSGGITKECELESEITTLGHFCLSLPLDLHLCKLVHLGMCFACPTEAIVMAASLSMRTDVFTIPLRALMKDDRYRDSLWNSVESRWKFDNGQFSEPIMYLNLFKAWYKFKCDHNNAGSREDVARLFVKEPRHQGISSNRLFEFETAINGIASRANRFVPKSKLYDSIQALSTATKQMSNRASGPGISNMAATSNVQFTADPTKLKCLLVAAFSQHLLQGIRNYEDTTRFGEEDRDIMKEASYEDINLVSPTRLFMEPITHASRKSSNDRPNESTSVTEHDLRMAADFICNIWRSDVKLLGRSNRIAVVDFSNVTEKKDFTKIPGYIVEQDALLTPSTSIFWQYGLRNKTWAVKNIQNLPRPNHPCSIAWYQVPEQTGIRNFVLAGGKRNPPGVMCDTKLKTPFIAVVASLMGTSSQNTTLGAGISVLPRLGGAAVTRSLLMVLSFLNFQTRVAIQTAEKQNGFSVFTVNGEKFDYSDMEDVIISVEDIVRINALRKKLSEVMASCSQELPLMKMEGIADLLQSLLYRKQEVFIPTSEQTATDRPIVAKNPVVMDGLTVTDPPVAIEDPIVTDPPVATEDPIVTDPPVASEEPIVTDPPVAIEDPIVTDPPVATEEPIVTDPPVASEEPIVTDPPVASEEPIATDPPVATEEPIATDPPIAVNEPIDVDPPIAVNEPIDVDPPTKLDKPEVNFIGTNKPVVADNSVTMDVFKVTDPSIAVNEPIVVVSSIAMDVPMDEPTITDNLVAMNRSIAMDNPVLVDESNRNESTATVSPVAEVTMVVSDTTDHLVAKREPVVTDEGSTDHQIKITSNDASPQLVSESTFLDDDFRWIDITEFVSDDEYILYPQYGQGTFVPLNACLMKGRRPESVSSTQQTVNQTLSLKPMKNSKKKPVDNITAQPLSEAARRLQRVTGSNIPNTSSAASLYQTRAGKSIAEREIEHSVKAVFENTVSPEASSDESDSDEMFESIFSPRRLVEDIPQWSQRLVHATACLCLKSLNFEASINVVQQSLFHQCTKKKVVVLYLRCVPSTFTLRPTSKDPKTVYFKCTTATLKGKDRELLMNWMKEEKYRLLLDFKKIEKYSREYAGYDRQSGFRDVKQLKESSEPIPAHVNPYNKPHSHKKTSRKKK